MSEIQTNSRPVNMNCDACGGARNQGEYCAYCGALYPNVVSAGRPRRKLISLAEKYRVKKFNDGMKISWRWWSSFHLILIPFALFWNFIAFALVNAFGSWRVLLSDPLSLFPIPFLHVVVGIGLLVYLAIRFINKTTIRADRQLLSIKHFPLPIGRKVSLPASQIEQIFVSKGQRSNKHNSWNVPILQLVTINGERIQLMEGQTEVEFSDYETISRNIHDALGIPVVAVAGAYIV